MTRLMNTPGSDMSPRRPGWLNSTILGIGLASLLSDLGHEMATTIMPAFLVELGVGSAALGLIEGVADGLSSFAKLASGIYSDRLERRKPLAVVGYFVTASAVASFALATRWWHVLLGRSIGWMGRGMRTPIRNVLLTDATTPETYGRAFGFERAMDSLGAVIGPSLSLMLVALVGMRKTLALTLIPGALAAVCILFLVRERAHAPRPGARFWHSVRSLPLDFKRYLVGVGIAGLGDFSNALLILWATQAFTPEIGAERAARWAISLYILYNVIYTASCYTSGALADKYSKKWVLAIGYSLAIVPAVALSLAGSSLGWFALAFAFSGVYTGVWETLENATAATLLPKELRGTGFGVLATVNGLGDFASSSIVGLLWVTSPKVAMTFVAIVSLVGAAIIASTRSPRSATGVG